MDVLVLIEVALPHWLNGANRTKRAQTDPKRAQTGPNRPKQGQTGPTWDFCHPKGWLLSYWIVTIPRDRDRLVNFDHPSDGDLPSDGDCPVQGMATIIGMMTNDHPKDGVHPWVRLEDFDHFGEGDLSRDSDRPENSDHPILRDGY